MHTHTHKHAQISSLWVINKDSIHALTETLSLYPFKLLKNGFACHWRKVMNEQNGCKLIFCSYLFGFRIWAIHPTIHLSPTYLSRYLNSSTWGRKTPSICKDRTAMNCDFWLEDVNSYSNCFSLEYKPVQNTLKVLDQWSQQKNINCIK